MALLNFPENPFNGQLYPNPCPAGVTQYRWDSTAGIWRIVGVATGVIPGTYGDRVTVGQFTVDSSGTITGATNVLIQNASLSQKGLVQLTNSTTSIDETKALSAKGAKALQDQIGNLSDCVVPDHINVVAALNALQAQTTNLNLDALIWCGYYNAEEGDISFVSKAGTRAGYIQGQELPVSSAKNGGDFFIVTKAGNPYIAGDFNAPDVFIDVSNWILSETNRWTEVFARGPVEAKDVYYKPSSPLTATNVQNALFQITQFFRTPIGGASVSQDKPSNPYPGQLWWDSNDGLFYIFYVDPNGAQWVEAGGGGSQQLSGGGGTVYEIRTGTGLSGGPITTEGEIYLEPAYFSPGNISDSVIGGVIPRIGFNYSNTTGILDVKLTDSYTGTDGETAFSQKGANDLNAKIESIGGNNILAGTYDAKNGVVVYATPAGAARGFVPGQNLPAASAQIDNYYVIVTIGGGKGPVGPQVSTPGDWYICQADNPTPVWFLIDFEQSTTQAVNVSIIPIPGISQAGNVQTALELIELQSQDRIEFAEAKTDGLKISISPPNPLSNDGTTLSLGLDYASIQDRGIVQLTNDCTGTSQTLAFTQYGANLLNSKVDALIGALTLAGTYNSNSGTVVNVTPAGAAAGFKVGQQAPKSDFVPDNYFLIVTVSGGYGPPGAVIPLTGVQSGDWFVNEKLDGGSQWITIDFENKAIAAINVDLAPVAGLSATNVQKGIEQLAASQSKSIVDLTSRNNGIGVTLSPDASNLGTDAAIILNPATQFDLGGVFVPQTTDGGINLTPEGSISLKVASQTSLGGIKVGNNLIIEPDGTLSATGGGGESQALLLDDISSQFNGTRITFSLTSSGAALPSNTQNALSFISTGGILQSPGRAYSINANSQITFSEAPPTGSSFYGRVFVNVATFSDGSGGIQAITFEAPLTGGTVTDVGTVGIVDSSPTQRGAMSAAQAAKLETLGTNGSGTRYVSTNAPSPSEGQNGDIWYQVQ